MRRLLTAAAVLAALLVAPAAGAWSWPSDGVVLRGFTLSSDVYAGGQHRGIDVAGVTGSPVRASAAGEVSFAGTVPSSGKSVTIQTADGYAVTLTHLGSIAVAKGDAVGEGQSVGTIGPSGDPEVDEPYVHLGVRVASDPNGYVDPLGFLPARVPAPPALVPPPTPAPPVVESAPSTQTAPPPAPPAPAEPASADPAPAPAPPPVAAGVGRNQASRL
ncbi:MAG: murein hydrolase activator EnvC family protein, partial [Gaiellaceae bacterium]